MEARYNIAYEDAVLRRGLKHDNNYTKDEPSVEVGETVIQIVF